jgi:glycosyltransferase involved in cell wall biosynthesis
MPADQRKIAIVVQRYGEDITGGSESLARAVAERLTTDYRVIVLTSCARDYVTWRNELPVGESVVNNVKILRFATSEERDLASFNAFAEPLYVQPHDEDAELEFLRRQGPVMPDLVEHLAETKDGYAAVIFFTYLYYPTYWGLRAAPERAILVPTAHDEPALRLSVFTQVFAAPRAFVFCSYPEQELVQARFSIGVRPCWIAGIGVDASPTPDVEAFRIRYDLHGAYALYAGRIDAGKGCAEMLEHYVQYRRRVAGGAELVLIGKLAMTMPRIPGVRYLGFLSETEKLAALAGARVVICPSPYESLSIVLLESLCLGTPALVNARSRVLVDHCLRSNAGLFYESADEFVEALRLLVKEQELHRALGERGRRYVDINYSWPVVIGRYREAIAAMDA